MSLGVVSAACADQAIAPAGANNACEVLDVAGARAPERVVALDGLRGILATMVLASHYFGSVPHGVLGHSLGWMAVLMFFVLSGFLVGKICLDNIGSENFFTVFYVRRACRTLPAYVLLLFIVSGCVAFFGFEPWLADQHFMPAWSYATFTQGFVMVARGDLGTEWLLPTWTLTVEEQFYLIAPLLCLLVPRRCLLVALVGGVLISIGFRAVVYWPGLLPGTTMKVVGMVTLPSVCYAMFLGMTAALLLKSPRLDWSRIDDVIRVAPIPLLIVAVLVTACDIQGGGFLHYVFGQPLIGIACACYLLAIMRGAPEGASLSSRPLRELGRMSYSIYLLHCPVLWLLHGVLLAGHPDIGTLPQVLVTVLAMPVTLIVSWASATWVEAPMIAYGRTWKWKQTRVEVADLRV